MTFPLIGLWRFINYTVCNMTKEKSIFDSDKEPEEIDKKKVVQLNDCLRTTFEGGRIVCTPGIAHLRESTYLKIFHKLREFNDFNPENDPYGEHDIGSIKADGTTVFWKIDYYDNNLEYHSPAKDNPKVTNRVLTVMLPEEY
jgi:hypothetical protein